MKFVVNDSASKINPIEKVIKENIFDEFAVFVFPTQTSANLWADRATRVTESTAVNLERFTTWDDFKSSSIKSLHQDKKSIPAVMRTIFAEKLIAQNKAHPFLFSIIRPEFAKTAYGFAKWISSMLPSLEHWKRIFDAAGMAADSEDKDYCEIYERYKDFLEKHNMFDPAWETPPFHSDGKKYFILFPEILMDYAEYQEILSSSKDIVLVHLPVLEDMDKPKCNFFSNSRAELHNLALTLRALHTKRGIKWTSIAISVPDIEEYAPYIERELSLYEIPFVQRNATALSQTGAGSFFVRAQDCVSENFSYASVKSFLMLPHLPWADPALHERLISFGQENNCICSWKSNEETFDVWEQSFANPVKEKADGRLVGLYKSLKKLLVKMTGAKNFADIKKAYFEFKNTFFDVSRFSVQSDRIISRCISELSSLIDLEAEFPDCTPPSPYSFFLNYLSEKMYVFQTEDRGVSILPYRLAASAPFACHCVINASQAAAGVVYKKLSFLSTQKKALLNLPDDPDMTEHFLKLYAFSAYECSFFTAAEKTFTSYALTNSALEEVDFREETKDFSGIDDMYAKEKSALLSPDSAHLAHITQHQHTGFAHWATLQGKSGPCSLESREKLNACIRERLCDKNGKVRVSYSVLKAFYDNPHDFMQQYVLGIKPLTSEAELIDRFAMGNLYHAILENYCKTLAKKNLPLKSTNDSLSSDYESILTESIESAVESFRVSALAKRLVNVAMDSLTEIVFATVVAFSKQFEGFKVFSVEDEYTYEPEGKNYFFTGRIDCLLKDESEGEYVLVDFKSTSGAIHKDIFFVSDDVVVPDFQMPLYVYLLRNQSKARKKIVENCAFFNVTAGKTVPVVGSLVNASPELSLKNTEERLLLLADYYAKRVSSGEIDSEEEVKSFLLSFGNLADTVSGGEI